MIRGRLFGLPVINSNQFYTFLCVEFAWTNAMYKGKEDGSFAPDGTYDMGEVKDLVLKYG